MNACYRNFDELFFHQGKSIYDLNEQFVSNTGGIATIYVHTHAKSNFYTCKSFSCIAAIFGEYNFVNVALLINSGHHNQSNKMENVTAKIIWIEIHKSQYKDMTFWPLEVIFFLFLRGPQSWPDLTAAWHALIVHEEEEGARFASGKLIEWARD